MRGERSSGHTASAPRAGSSPHTRGTQLGGRGRSAVERFIPAYAGNAYKERHPGSRRSVHPRIRGERWIITASRIDARGSSPHTRGTPVAVAGIAGCCRFIPAYAGNASGRAGKTRPAAVHPRIRGERWIWARSGTSETGSSPHTRGTRRGRGRKRLFLRFIPAYAGNAVRAPLAMSSTSVHPRIRGERDHAQQVDDGSRGSSPHTRGTRNQLLLQLRRLRFIPAYAGNALPISY